MPRLTIIDEPDCGNAPRKELLRDLAIAVATADAVGAAALMRDDIVWTVVGRRRIEGIEALREWVGTLRPANELRFASLITHGREACVSGEVARGDERTAFCHVLRFAGAARSAPIVAVDSFEIEG